MSSKTALISGASGGIGAAVAQHLQAEGWSLSLGARRVDALAEAFPDAHVTHHDAMQRDEAAWASAALDRFGRIDAVICSAGAMIARDPLEIDDAELNQMWEINVNSPRRLVKACWDPLAASGSGRVVILASLSGKRVRSPKAASYAMTKHAAVALSHGIRKTGWDLGIRSTAICPGFVDTDMARKVTDFPPADMTRSADIAKLVSLALTLPNSASMAELSVNCTAEDQY